MFTGLSLISIVEAIFWLTRTITLSFLKPKGKEEEPEMRQQGTAEHDPEQAGVESDKDDDTSKPDPDAVQVEDVEGANP